MKIGIVGSGIAGLAAAWMLRRAGHSTTIFENQNRIGMDAHSVQIPLVSVAPSVALQNGSGKPSEFSAQTPMAETSTVSGDVPSRMFNSLLWPRLYRLYQELGVEIEAVNPTQSFHRDGDTYLNLEIANRPQTISTMLRSKRARHLLSEAQRLKKQGQIDLDRGLDSRIEFLDYLHRNGYSNEFCFDFLFPTLSSTVCTCSYQALADYPAVILLDSLSRMSQNQPLMKTTFGTGDVVRRLTKSVDDIRLRTKVRSVVQDNSKVQLVFETEEFDHGQQSESFDHVIVATQANHAVGMLPQISQAELQCLASFIYENIRVVVHRDAGLLPENKQSWATFNMGSTHLTASNDSSSSNGRATAGENSAMCSVWMNRFHSDWDPEVGAVFQTINPIRAPKPQTIICSAGLQRPVVRTHSFTAWNRLEELHRSPGRRIWFTGSYASLGIPLLETAVEASMNVARHMGVELGEWAEDPGLKKEVR